MKFVCVILGVLFVAAGISFALGKGHIHLAAWKRMSRKEQDRIRIGPLCLNIGEVIALSGVIFLLRGLWPGFESHWFTAAVLAWLLIAGFDVWYIAGSGRYYRS